MTANQNPSLQGVHVLTIAPNLPGPLTARHLLQLGATVTKVETPGGDPMIAIPQWYEALNTGQNVKNIDLKTSDGQEEFARLLETSDLLLSSMRPQAAERLNLYDMVRSAGVAHVEIVGDVNAPNEPGHDITYQAAAGVLSPPDTPRVLLADTIGGYRATIAALDALRERDQALAANESKVIHRRIGLKQGVEEAAEAFTIGGTAPGQILSGSAPQYGLYQTSDGWIALAAVEPHFYATLTRLLGESRAELEQRFVERSTTDWLQFAQEHDLPLSEVKTDPGPSSVPENEASMTLNV